MVEFHRLLVLKLGSMLSVTRGETHRLASFMKFRGNYTVFDCDH